MNREAWIVTGLVILGVTMAFLGIFGPFLWPDLGMEEPRTKVCWVYADGPICKTWPGGLITTH